MTTIVCPACENRWKIVPEGAGDVAAVCPVCREHTAMVPLLARDGTVRAVALIDADCAELVAPYTWRRDGKGYGIRPVKLETGWTAQLLHRFLLGLAHGDPREGDHKNGNPLDCRHANLRVVARGRNQQNRRGYGSSVHRGVSWDKRRRMWRAYAKLDGRQYGLGHFDDEMAARDAAVAWRAEHMPFATDRS